MTFDIVALCREQPGPGAMLAAMRAAGPELRVNTIDEAQLIQLYHEDGRLMMTTEGARLVQVRGEVRRLLGFDEDVPHPVWWVETRAPGGDPEAEAAARRFTQALVTTSGGVSWSTR
ncbi:hypothetical protein HUO13_03125 [Saccharopolyspora erythraea]|uniref:hypothetical protein n=1 Tax=Saccharopolyspora erythraea TaxID=1836 RepID=UPI001BA91C3C|nr:hypothetical protein [Saccharopolyspora erythraea]QUG99930.1 hypothetical protein HUO13_03125 [Saccharopolyspora erythraea]